MNEKIKELYEQAGSYASTKTNIVEEWEWIRDKKFAELIILECSLRCLEDKDSQRILQHFGVE